MSYALKFANDATSDLKELPPWLQEEVLDEIETLLETPPKGMRIDAWGRATHDFARSESSGQHVVFLRLHIDRKRSLLTVAAIKDWSM